jgi:hypothetical protein
VKTDRHADDGGVSQGEGEGGGGQQVVQSGLLEQGVSPGDHDDVHVGFLHEAVGERGTPLV